jgi:hypothetical protein
VRVLVILVKTKWCIGYPLSYFHHEHDELVPYYSRITPTYLFGFNLCESDWMTIYAIVKYFVLYYVIIYTMKERPDYLAETR